MLDASAGSPAAPTSPQPHQESELKLNIPAKDVDGLRKRVVEALSRGEKIHLRATDFEGGKAPSIEEQRMGIFVRYMELVDEVGQLPIRSTDDAQAVVTDLSHHKGGINTSKAVDDQTRILEALRTAGIL